MNPIINKRSILVVIILVAIFIGLNFWGGSTVKNFLYKQSSSLQAFLWQKGSEAAFARKNQEDLNKQLIEQNQSLLSQVADLDSLKKENETLRQALSFGLNADFDLIMAEVTAKNDINLKGVAYGDSLLINKGNVDGVQKGFPVVLASKILIGRVVDVYDNFSRVMLITSKDSIIDVQIQDTDTLALAKGQGGKLYLDMFPKEKELKQGAVVTTSALGSAYPSGLAVGTVGQINSLDSESFQKAEINPAYDLSTLTRVFIIKNVIISNE
ncbi:MAG: rod shape-determining protein MreC [Candidatus Pacebacteria bacterium]|nr:rod shape-determining protein MreC [Candidatus Paceibacterota bacterium]